VEEEKAEVPTPSASEALKAIRVVNCFYEARAGNSIVSQIMGIKEHLENQYWASRGRHMKIMDYSTLTEYLQDVTACAVRTVCIMNFLTVNLYTNLQLE
jgi:hypothetical protein